MTETRQKLTLPQLAQKKAAGERLVMVAVGEVLTATWAERAGVDIVGVGDSLGMTFHGHENTLAMTVDQMIMHTQAVRRGAPNTLCLVSMPYGSYATLELAVTNAVRIMKESGADAVKLQLGREGAHIIRAVADAGVPVMSHVGLLPHKVHQMGGFKMQGRTAEAAMEIVENARAIEAAGAIGLEIEAMPYEVGKAVDDAVAIFTFSIGAGAAGNGLIALILAECEEMLVAIFALTTRIDAKTLKLKKLSKQSEISRRLQTIPGVGPLTAMAIEAFAPPMEIFRCGRDFAARIGLVPKQHSSGNKARLP